MSAEFFLACCPLPVVAEGETINETDRAMLLQHRIDNLSEEVLTDLADWFLGTFEIDEEGNWQHEALDRVRECLEFVEQGGSRETALLTFEGRDWIFAGGMSSGDTPSEAFDDLWLLAVAGVTFAPLTKEPPASDVDPESPTAPTDS